VASLSVHDCVSGYTHPGSFHARSAFLSDSPSSPAYQCQARVGPLRRRLTPDGTDACVWGACSRSGPSATGSNSTPPGAGPPLPVGGS